jgi:hypothetical protein
MTTMLVTRFVTYIYVKVDSTTSCNCDSNNCDCAGGYCTCNNDCYCDCRNCYCDGDDCECEISFDEWSYNYESSDEEFCCR